MQESRHCKFIDLTVCIAEWTGMNGAHTATAHHTTLRGLYIHEVIPNSDYYDDDDNDDDWLLVYHDVIYNDGEDMAWRIKKSWCSVKESR